MPQYNTSSTAKKAPLNHELYMSILMTPDMANFIGNVHGGDLLKMLDQVAYACASRYSGNYVVTLSVDQVMFREPIYVANWLPLRQVSTMWGILRWRSAFASKQKMFEPVLYAIPTAAILRWSLSMIMASPHLRRHLISKIPCSNAALMPH